MRKKVIYLLIMLTMVCGALFVACNTESGVATNQSSASNTTAALSDCDQHKAGELRLYSESSCKMQGLYSGDCIYCGAPILIPAPLKPHVWVLSKVIQAPTEFENGIEEYICFENGSHEGHTEERVSPALGEAGHVHSWGDWVVKVEPTCHSEGLRTKYCKNPAHEYQDGQPIPRLEHIRDTKWTTIFEPTEMSAGSESILCVLCGNDLQTRKIAPTGTLSLTYRPYTHNGFDGYLITGDTKHNKNVFVPPLHNGKPIFGVDSYAFAESNIEAICFIQSESYFKYIGDYAFYKSKIFSMYFEDDSAEVDYVGYYAFSETPLRFFNADIKVVGDYAFCNANLVDNNKSQWNFDKIGKYAFANGFNNKDLVMLYIYVKEIGEYAFAGIDLYHFELYFKSEERGTVPEGLFDGAKINTLHFKNAIIKRAPINMAKTIVLIDSETESLAFYGDTTLLELNLRSIDKDNIVRSYAFAGTKLQYVHFSDKVSPVADIKGSNIIGLSAFSDCFDLKKVSLEDDKIELGERAFYNCVKLTEVYPFNIHETQVEKYYQGELHIGEKAFYDCPLEGFYDGSFMIFANTIKKEAFNKLTAKNIFLMNVKHYEKDAIVSSYLQRINLKNFEADNDCREAFANCKNLTTVYIKGDIPYSKGLFAGQNSINELILDQVRVLADELFMNCKNLSIRNFTGVEVVGKATFKACTSLSEVFISSFVIINDEAFRDCTNLRVTTSDYSGYSKLEYIGKRAFYACTSISPTKQLTLHEPLQKIDDLAFAHSGVVDVTLPKSVKHISIGAFTETGLRSINLEHVQYIEMQAFCRLPNLVSIGNNNELNSELVPMLETAAFYDCPKLKVEIYYRGTNIEFNADAFMLIGHSKLIISDDIKVLPADFIRTRENINEVYFGDNTQIEVIEERAFSSASNIKTLELPSTLKVIKEYAFEDARIDEIKIPGSVEYMGKSVFESSIIYRIEFDNENSNLKTLNIGDILYGCYALEDLVLPSNLTHITEETLKVEQIRKTASLQYTFLKYLTLSSNAEEITIGDNAFKNIRNLKMVYNANNVVKIGAYAFSGCKNLELLKVNYTFEYMIDYEYPKLKEIGEYAFSACSNFNGFYAQMRSLEIIRERAFLNCTKVGLVLFDCIKVIEQDAFYGLSSGTIYVGALTLSEATVVANRIKTEFRSAFNNCTASIGAYEFPVRVLWGN